MLLQRWPLWLRLAVEDEDVGLVLEHTRVKSDDFEVVRARARDASHSVPLVEFEDLGVVAWVLGAALGHGCDSLCPLARGQLDDHGLRHGLSPVAVPLFLSEDANATVDEALEADVIRGVVRHRSVQSFGETGSE